MRETIKSLRIYFIVIGIVQVYNIIKNFKALQSNIILGLIGIISLIFGLLYFYFGIKLNSFITKSTGLIINFLIAQMVFSVLSSLFLFAATSPVVVFISLLIGIGINLYLILNVKRLAKENQYANIIKENEIPTDKYNQSFPQNFK